MIDRQASIVHLMAGGPCCLSVLRIWLLLTLCILGSMALMPHIQNSSVVLYACIKPGAMQPSSRHHSVSMLGVYQHSHTGSLAMTHSALVYGDAPRLCGCWTRPGHVCHRHWGWIPPHGCRIVARHVICASCLETSLWSSSP
jgi:hypothetical protein